MARGFAIQRADVAAGTDAAIARVELFARHVQTEADHRRMRSRKRVLAFKAATDDDARQLTGAPIAQARGQQDRAHEILVADSCIDVRAWRPDGRVVTERERRRKAVTVECVEPIERIRCIRVGSELIAAQDARIVAISLVACRVPAPGKPSERAVHAPAAHDLLTARVLEAAVRPSRRTRESEPYARRPASVGAISRECAKGSARRRQLAAGWPIRQNLNDAADRRIAIERGTGSPEGFDPLYR